MKIFKIEENDADQRLDKFLKKLFPNATRSLIYKFNRKNKIKIKSDNTDFKFKKMDNEYKLKKNDEIKIFLSDSEFESLNKKQITTYDKSNYSLSKSDIVYEDSSLLVINKNPWINVHAGDHKTKETNIINQVHDYLWNSVNSLTFKPSLIHRIDRDTSWLLLIWKKKDILTKLVWDFKDHKKVKKVYYAIVLWKLSRKSWTIKKSLKRIHWAVNQNKVQVSESWQSAISNYKLLKEHTINTAEWKLTFSEVEINIETWRMHQIRVHMSSIWNPILWDKVYWNQKINRFLELNYWLTRQALHAWRIDFFHYSRNKKFSLEARLKDDLKKFLDKIVKE